MRISNSDPTSFSEWLLSVHSFLDTRTNLHHYWTKEQGIQHPFQENLLRSIKLYNKTGANYFYLAEHKRLIITEQLSSRIICEDSILLLGKAFSLGARPWPPPTLCIGSHTASTLAHRLLAFDITSYHKASTVLRLLLLKDFNWADTFAEALVV